MKISLIPNTHAPNASEVISAIEAFCKKRKIAIVPPSAESDFFLTLGGDGTLLRAAAEYGELGIPFLGINLGHLGFMADVPVAELEESLADLKSGAYTVEERIRLIGRAPGGEKTVAINDFVLYRGVNTSLVEIDVHVDGIPLSTFEADGLILATPGGSTAYSLAAGGPIVTPGNKSVVLTPICAHTISVRPIVLPATATIALRYLSHYQPLEVTADGGPPLALKTGDTYTISLSETPFRLVSLERTDYFSTLRKKLGWTGKLHTRAK